MLEMLLYELSILHIYPTYFQFSDDKHVYVYKCTNNDIQMYIYKTRSYEC